VRNASYFLLILFALFSHLFWFQWHAWKGSKKFEDHGGLHRVCHLSLLRYLSIIGSLELHPWSLILDIDNSRGFPCIHNKQNSCFRFAVCYAKMELF
jgi:hypothetical protein